MQKLKLSITATNLEEKVFSIRGKKVMIDRDLAELYGVSTKRLNEQVRRNHARFPEVFMFQLSTDEKTEVVAKCDHLKILKYSSFRPFAFTEHGVLMLANVLNSKRAVKMSIRIIEVFIRMREMLTAHREFSERLKRLEDTAGKHGGEIQAIIEALKQLVRYEECPKRTIGFKAS